MKFHSQHDPVTFYLDKCLGRYTIAEKLRTEGHIVELHTDHFPEDAPDADWLPEIGKRGWVILTKDNQIHRNQIEIAALLKSNTAAFVLRSRKMTGDQMAAAFAKAVPHIKRFLRKFEKPFVATIAASGSVSLLLTLSDLIKKIR